MGLLDRWRGVRDVAQGGPDTTFAIDAAAVPAAIFGLASYEDVISPVARISRAEAIQVPGVKRARDLVCGTLGGLPLRYLDARFDDSTNQLFQQPERDVPRSVTMTRLFEDLFFEGVGWWRITGFDYRGYPSQVVRLDPRSVDVRTDQRVYVSRNGRSQGTATEYVPDSELIRFYSPNDALLDAGARAIRTCLKLDAAAARSADEPMPTGMFTPAEGADPADEDNVVEILDAWAESRRTRRTAYVNAALNYQPLAWNPEQMQLSDARQHAVLEIARVCGVDPEDLGVSTTSRTYQNSVDRKQALIDFTLAGYINAVQDRLSMGDITPRGYLARFDFSGFIRSDEKTRMETYQIATQLGAYDLDEVRRREELPETVAPAPVPMPAPAPVPVPQKEIV